MTRHIEYELNLKEDVTCWGDAEDFETDLTEEDAKEIIEDWLSDFVWTDDIFNKIKIKKIWFEND